MAKDNDWGANDVVVDSDWGQDDKVVSAPINPEKSRTWGEALKDAGAEILGSTLGVAKLGAKIGDKLFVGQGESNPAIKFLNEYGDAVNEQKSDVLKAKQAKQSKEIERAEKEARAEHGDGFGGDAAGFFAGLKEGAATTISDPALLLSMAAQQIPMMGSMGAGSLLATKLASGVATIAPKVAATKAGQYLAKEAATGGSMATGMALQGSDVGSQTYAQMMELPQDVWQGNNEFQTLSARIGEQAAKHEIADRESTKAGGYAALASLATMTVIPGGKSIEKAMAGGKAIPVKAIPGAIAGETFQEGSEEGLGKLAGNAAVATVDPSQRLMQGVGGATGQGGVAGGLMSGGINSFRAATDRPIAPDSPVVDPLVAQLQAQADKGGLLSRVALATNFPGAGAQTGVDPGIDPQPNPINDLATQPADAGFLTPADSTYAAAPIADNFEANQAVAHEPLAQEAIESIASDDKSKWLKAIADQNRTAGDTGVQLTVSEDGQLTFLGNPKATRQGLALEATLQEALKAGATVPDIVTHLSQPVVEATAPAPLVGEPINQRWTAFHPASGTLNVPRAEMPQIKSEHRGAMVNFLKARGIGGEAETVAATDLKPTQTEFSPSKVKKAMDYVGGDRPVLVSSDGYVLDGHHQWLAKAQQDVPVAITRLNAPIKDLLVAMRDFPSAGMTKEAAKDGRTQVQAPVVEAAPVSPGNPGNQPIRARRAALTQLASQGFSQVESDALGHRLVNPESNTEVVLDSSFDALLAKQAIANYTGQQTTGVQNGQETGAASAGVDSRGSTEAGVNPRDGGVRYSTEQSKRDGRELPGGATSDQRQTDTARQGVERLAANNATRVSEAHRDINDHRNDLIAQYHASTDQVERGRIYDEVAHLPAMGHPPAAELQAFSEMAHNWSITMGGRPPVAYWDQSSSASDGFEQYGNTYVNLANPTMALQWTIGHEAEHGQEKTATQEEQALRVELWNEVTPQGRAIFFENFLFKGKKYANATPRQLAKLKSEMLAEFNGELFTNVDWLNKLQKQKPNLFGKFVSEWIPTLSRMIDSLKSRYGVGQDSPKSVMKFMRDLESAKDIAMKIAISWAERNPKLAQSTGAGAAIQHSARATDEYTDVESRLKGTEQWLKAPNGQATKLTERQWVQTRTPSFKNWFGDFEAFAKLPGGVWNDDKGAVSKAVDANGDPVIVYHGTDKGGFMSFQQPGGERRGDLGIFTTSNEGMAHSYVRKGRANRIADPGLSDVAEWWNDEGGANEEIPFGDLTDKDVAAAAERYWDEVAQYEDKKAGVYAAFVNLRNPNETDFEGALWNGSREHQYIVLVDGETMVRKDGKQYFDDEDEAKAFAREFPNPLYEDDDGSDYVRQALDEHWETTDQAVREGRQNKNDGTIIRQVVDDGGGPGYDLTPSDVFIAFNPNQIKSADFNTGEFGEPDDIRYSTREAAIGDRTDVTKLPVGRAIPDSVGIGSLEKSLELARSKSYSKGRQLKVDLQDRVLQAAALAKIDLSAKTQETFKFLVGMVTRDAQFALDSNANAVGWYDKTVSRAIGALTTLHPEIETDPSARLAFLWALATTSNGLKVNLNFKLAEGAYRQWRATGVMPSDVGIGNAASSINKGLALHNTLSEKFGSDRLFKFMATEFEVGQIGRMLGETPGGEWMTTPVLGSAVIGPKIGNGFFSNLNGYFQALTIDRWLMRTWGRFTGTLLEVNPVAVAKFRTKLSEAIAGMSEPERKLMAKLINSPVRKTMTRAELDALSVEIAKTTMKPEKREVMMATGATNLLRLAGNNLSKAIDGQKEAPSGPSERNWMRAVFAQALTDLKADGKDMTMSDLQALLWYPERRLYDAAKSDEETSNGYTDDEAPDYANAAQQLALSHQIAPEVIAQAMDRAEARGTVRGLQLTEQEKSELLQEFRKPPEQSTHLAYEVAPDPSDAALVAEWGQLSVKDRTNITKVAKDAVLEGILNLVGIKADKTVAATGGFAGLINPNLITQYKPTTTSLAQARTLAAAIGYALDQDSVALVDARAAYSNGMVRVTFDKSPAKHLEVIFDAIRKAVPEIDGFTSRGNNFDILNFTGRLTTEELSGKVMDALHDIDAPLEFVMSHGDIQSELVEKDSYEGYINGLRPASGAEGSAGIDGLRDRARQVVAQEVRSASEGGLDRGKRTGAKRAGAARRDVLQRSARVERVFGYGSGDGRGTRLRLAKGQEAVSLRSFKLSDKESAELLQEGISSPALHELDPGTHAGDFQYSITESKIGNKYASSVHVYDRSEYSGMRLFMTDGGKTGFALKGDDIVSVFNYDPKNKRAAGVMLDLAIQLGGRRLDAFDTVLPHIYGDHGFRAVARTAWNDDYSPAGWDKLAYEKYNNGEPDVVFMAYDRNHDTGYKPGDGALYQGDDAYDDAVAAQQRAAKQFETSETRNEQNTIQSSTRELADDGRGRGSDPAGERLPPRYGQAIPGAVSATGYHFSRQARTHLSGDYYGTGLKGAESERLTGPGNADIRPRVFFYVSKGNGVRAESGVGAYGHHIQLDNLYDVYKDPLSLVKRNPGANNWERAVLQAGFDGYLANDPVMPQGFAVLLGKKHGAVPVAQTQAPGASPNPVIEKPKSQHDTVREGNELVRKPTAPEIVALANPERRSKVKESAPSFVMQYGFFRVKTSEAAAADLSISEFSPTFRFGELQMSAREDVKQVGPMSNEDRHASLLELLGCV